MTPTLRETQWSALHQGLAALAHFSREGLGDGALAARLEALVARQPAAVPPAGEPQGAVELEQALALAASIHALLGLMLGTAGSDSRDGALQWAQEAAQAVEGLASRLGARLRARVRQRLFGLYVIIDPQVTGGREPLEIARAALEGGARILQLRDKARDKGQSLPLAWALQELCRQHQAVLIINDHADLAVAAGADGVHVGQQDLPVAEVRRILEPWQIVGRSNALVSEALESQAQGADYIAVGSIYPTSTKERTRPAGLETLRRVRQQVSLPVVAIGGIKEENVGPVVKAGADAICVVSAVSLAPDPQQAAQRLVQGILAAGGRA